MNPLELHIELTHSCPLNCAPCDHRLAVGAKLPLSSLKKLFRSPLLEELRLVVFSGGEPTLHPGFEDAVLAAAKSFPGARLLILTSLYETKRLEAFLKSLPPTVIGRLHIGSSLDGPPRLHDRIRGRAGAFARLKAAHARIKKRHPGISTGFTFTATSLNTAYFHQTWRIAADVLKAPLGLQFLVPNSNTSGLKPDLKDKMSLAKNIRRVLSEINKSQQSGTNYSIEECLRFKLALDLLAGKTKPAGKCGAGRTFAMLSPEGRFYLCPFHKGSVLGSIDSPFNKVWTAENSARAFKKAGSRSCVRCFLRCTL